MRQGSVELRRKLAEVNDALQSRGTRWAQKVSALAVCMIRYANVFVGQKRELTNARKVQQNVEDAIEALQSSLVVLESANKVNDLLERKKYYAALKVSTAT